MFNFTQKYPISISRIAAYTTLAAAGLAVEPATAGVITSGAGFVPVTIAPGQTKAINFGGGVGSVFQFGQTLDFSSGFSALIQRGPNGGTAQSIMIPGGGNDPARVGSGYVISAGKAWYFNDTGTLNDVGGASAGNWNAVSSPGTVVRGYLGVRFTSAALSPGLHYGFFDVSFDNNPTYRAGTMTVYGWAYEDQADTAITTQSTVPEPMTAIPAGLGLLALGASGLRARRRKATAPVE